MSAWTEDDLRRIGGAEELEIASVRAGGELRRRTPIWVARADDGLYVRAAHIGGSGWHGVARASGRARIWAGGGYRSKYGSRYASIVDTINDAEHRATTLRLVPQ